MKRQSEAVGFEERHFTAHPNAEASPPWNPPAMHLYGVCGFESVFEFAGSTFPPSRRKGAYPRRENVTEGLNGGGAVAGFGEHRFPSE